MRDTTEATGTHGWLRVVARAAQVRLTLPPHYWSAPGPEQPIGTDAAEPPTLSQAQRE